MRTNIHFICFLVLKHNAINTFLSVQIFLVLVYVEMNLYLQSEQIVNSTDDDVDRSCAACLCAQIVLEI